jgi:hypothetical protein
LKTPLIQFGSRTCFPTTSGKQSQIILALYC